MKKKLTLEEEKDIAENFYQEARKEAFEGKIDRFRLGSTMARLNNAERKILNKKYDWQP